MLEYHKKEQFYQLLHDVFTGAKIQGEGGFINLLAIKTSYYQKVIAQFKKEVELNNIIAGSFQEEFFDKLYTFFERYFSESGSVYFCKTAYGQKIYEQVYTDNKDVILFWKTSMLYYVKSETLYQNANVIVQKDETEYSFFFDVSKLEHKKNNEKKVLIYNLAPSEEQGTFCLFVAYSKQGSKTKFAELAKAMKIPQDFIEAACKKFEKQSEIDYFLNKDAKKFLKEQLELYLHQYLLHTENKFSQSRLNQIKTVQDFALKLIDFISQFENELVQIWNKPKFVINSNYVITLDKLKNGLIQKITKHSNFQKQIKEWQELGMINNEFEFSSKASNHHLPIDTKYFKDLELEILSLFDNLDEALDGKLIHSENYQALNNLQARYKKKVQCIYIDPPFNLDSNGDFDYKVNYKDANWATMLENRLQLAHRMLDDTGSIFVRCDYHGNFIVRCLLDKIFGRENFRNEIVVNRSMQMGSTSNNFPTSFDFLFLYSKTSRFILYDVVRDRICKYCKQEKQPEWIIMHSPGERKPPERKIFNKIYFPPKGRHWTFVQSTIDKLISIKELIIDENMRYIDMNSKKIIGMPKYLQSEKQNLEANWTDIIGYSKTQNFTTENSEILLQRVVQTASQNDELVLDYFAGSGTTQAVAHKLGKKWLGVEMGKQCFGVILPRMKQVLFGKQNGISKELTKSKQLKTGGFFQYYSLEQYEDTLRKMQYKDLPKELFTQDKQTFEEYIFFADQKFAHLLEISKNNNIKLNFNNLYQGIDLAETLSHRYGLPIKSKTKEEVVLQSGKELKTIKINPENMTNEQKLELVKHLKPYLWWGE